MRGKVQNQEALSAGNGITPAYAGKSETDSGTAPGPKDHPRVCGEKYYCVFYRLAFCGSPPRMRGKVPPACCFCPALGITPAYAGKSNMFIDYTASARDHPRVCGEKMESSERISSTFGSPPRMRGKD